MKVTLMLADAAQAVGGKLYILGGGWSLAGPGPITMALAIKVEVPWDRANERLKFKLELVDADGQPVEVPSPPDGLLRPVALEGEMEVGRPPGLRAGTPLDSTMAINLDGIGLPPGERFTWRFEIDGQTSEHWQSSFTTRPAGRGTPPHPMTLDALRGQLPQ
ncbi:MAG: hypothetical protein ABR592_12255 [Nitriliruptorales bacterium]